MDALFLPYNIQCLLQIDMKNTLLVIVYIVVFFPKKQFIEFMACKKAECFGLKL